MNITIKRSDLIHQLQVNVQRLTRELSEIEQRPEGEYKNLTLRENRDKLTSTRALLHNVEALPGTVYTIELNEDELELLK